MKKNYFFIFLFVNSNLLMAQGVLNFPDHIVAWGQDNQLLALDKILPLEISPKDKILSRWTIRFRIVPYEEAEFIAELRSEKDNFIINYIVPKNESILNQLVKIKAQNKKITLSEAFEKIRFDRISLSSSDCRYVAIYAKKLEKLKINLAVANSECNDCDVIDFIYESMSNKIAIHSDGDLQPLADWAHRLKKDILEKCKIDQ